MSYVPHHAHLTVQQAKTLINGGSVRIPHQHLTGEHGVFLTRQQMGRFQKAHAKGQGVTLRMSQAQLRHNIRGGGFLSSAWKLIKEPVKEIGKKVIEKGLEKLPGVIGAIGEAAKAKLDKHTTEGSFLNTIGTSLINSGKTKGEELARKGADKLNSKIDGLGVGKGRKRKA